MVIGKCQNRDLTHIDLYLKLLVGIVVSLTALGCGAQDRLEQVLQIGSSPFGL